MGTTIIRHLNTHSKLMRNNPAKRMKALATASAIGNWKCCDHCGKIQIKIRQVGNEHLCRTCHKKNSKAIHGKVETNSIRKTTDSCSHPRRKPDAYENTKRCHPQLRRLWGECLTCVLERVASAKTDEDAYTALEAWAKQQVVQILPTRGGRKKKESRMRTHHRLMLQWKPEISRSVGGRDFALNRKGPPESKRGDAPICLAHRTYHLIHVPPHPQKFTDRT